MWGQSSKNPLRGSGGPYFSEPFAFKLFNPAKPFRHMANTDGGPNQSVRIKNAQSPDSDQDDELNLNQYSTEVLEAALGVVRAREAAAKKSAPENTRE